MVVIKRVRASPAGRDDGRGASHRRPSLANTTPNKSPRDGAPRRGPCDFRDLITPSQSYDMIGGYFLTMDGGNSGVYVFLYPHKQTAETKAPLTSTPSPLAMPLQ